MKNLSLREKLKQKDKGRIVKIGWTKTTSSRALCAIILLLAQFLLYFCVPTLLEKAWAESESVKHSNIGEFKKTGAISGIINSPYFSVSISAFREGEESPTCSVDVPLDGKYSLVNL